MHEPDFHSPDVAQRRTLDGGFSDGWGAHFLPAEEYVTDCHMHISEKEPWAVRRALDVMFDSLAAYRLDHVTVVDGSPGSVDAYSEVARADRRFSFMVWMQPERPDVEFLRRAHKAGAVGVKLHNHRVMRGEFDWRIWDGPEWSRVFAVAEELGLPVLWHVTQVESPAPYSGEGGGGSLKAGRERGLTLTNAALLEQFLRIVDAHPGITFIGAHQLYVGDATLDRLFAAHRNLTVDTSCGYFLRFGDRMVEEDIQAARQFFGTWPDRLLFATDNRLGMAYCNEVCFEAFRCHLRFIHALRLTEDAIQKVMWQNAKRILRLPDGDGTMTATTRP